MELEIIKNPEGKFIRYDNGEVEEYKGAAPLSPHTICDIRLISKDSRKIITVISTKAEDILKFVGEKIVSNYENQIKKVKQKYGLA